MPLYHLDIRDGEDLATDVEGEEQPDLGAARASALVAAKELLAIALREGASLKDALHRVIENQGRQRHRRHGHVRRSGLREILAFSTLVSLLHDAAYYVGSSG